MSIYSEITRISSNVADSIDAVVSKGGTFPSGGNSDDLADAIMSIPEGTGGSEKWKIGVAYSDPTDSSENSLFFAGLLGEPKAFIITDTEGGDLYSAAIIENIVSDKNGASASLLWGASYERVDLSGRIGHVYNETNKTVLITETPNRYESFRYESVYRMIYVYGSDGEFGFRTAYRTLDENVDSLSFGDIESDPYTFAVVPNGNFSHGSNLDHAIIEKNGGTASGFSMDIFELLPTVAVSTYSGGTLSVEARYGSAFGWFKPVQWVIYYVLLSDLMKTTKTMTVTYDDDSTEDFDLIVLAK